MPSYLQRYIAGEHEAVWDELLALGAAVRDEPLYSDALAVARETMTRARHNVELLVARLTEERYKPSPTYKPLNAADTDEISKVEAKVGLLPLSLKEWYRLIGEIDLSGTHPQWKVRGYDDGSRLLGIFNQPAHINTEPLQLFAPSLDGIDTFATDARVMNGRREDFKIMPPAGTAMLWIAHDSNSRTGFCPGGVDCILLQGPTAGGWVAEFEGNYIRETFVQYLRRSFQWGGFPGFARVDESLRPTRWLAELTEGLLPI